MIEERRSLGMYILLTLVTCGIYSFYFYYKFAQDMNTVCDGDGEHTAGLGYYILFSFLTCGIYAFYWYYKVGTDKRQTVRDTDCIFRTTEKLFLYGFSLALCLRV